MNDTSPEITEKVCEMFRMRTPVERLKMGCAMYDTSRYLVIRAIKEQNPTLTELGLRKELFLKFYGNDFSLIEQDKFFTHLEKLFS